MRMPVAVGAGLGTPLARGTLAAVWVLGLTSSLLGGMFRHPDPVLAGAFAVALLGALLLTSPGAHVLSGWRAGGVVATSVATAWLVAASGVEVGEIWLLDFASYLLALLLARGNVLAALGGAAVFFSSIGTWALLRASTVDSVTQMLTIPLLAMIVGTAWHLVLRWAVARERRHRTRAGRSALAAELAAQAAASDRRDLAAVRRIAGGLLERIARGEPIDEEAHRELVVAEAAIRDGIRSPWLPHPELTELIADRRRAGVQVVFIGEAQADRRRLDDALASAIATILRSVTTGQVTLRAWPPGRDCAVSVLVAAGGETVRVEFAADGAELLRS